MQRELPPRPLVRVGETTEDVQPTAFVRRRLRVGAALERELARALPGRDRRLGLACRGPVLRQELRSLRRHVGEALREDLGHPPVQLTSPRPQQRLVGRLLHERVLEEIRRIGREPARVEQLRARELFERILEALVRERRDGAQERVAELAPQDGRHLRHLLRRPEPVEARHQ